MDKPMLVNDDLLDLLGKLYIELKIARLLGISFAEFAADHENHLLAAAMLYMGGDLCKDGLIQDDGCMREGALDLAGLLPELHRVSTG